MEPEQQQTHNQLMRGLGNIEGKVDGINQRLDKLNGSVAKQEERIKSLENDRSKILGLAAGIGSMSGIAVAWVKDKFWN